MIDVADLTKKYGSTVAVDSLSFSVRPGVVTGFLGPNGAGKSTTMRCILGLDRPTGGKTRVNGRPYKSTKSPMSEVGALLETKAIHPGRSARNHLRALAATHGISKKRVDEVIEMVGLETVARKRAGGFSLGMTQRLGLAAALLGDPQTLILDEPINGLDPEGVAWVRNLVRKLASEGKTIFLSSHLMSEVAQVADHVVIIGRGRLIKEAPMADLVAQASGVVTRVRSPQVSDIAEAVNRSGRQSALDDDGSLVVHGLSGQQIGVEAARLGWELHELSPITRSLEDIYMELTNSAQEFQGSPIVPPVPTKSISSPPAPPSPRPALEPNLETNPEPTGELTPEPTREPNLEPNPEPVPPPPPPLHPDPAEEYGHEEPLYSGQGEDYGEPNLPPEPAPAQMIDHGLPDPYDEQIVPYHERELDEDTPYGQPYGRTREYRPDSYPDESRQPTWTPPPSRLSRPGPYPEPPLTRRDSVRPTERWDEFDSPRRDPYRSSMGADRDVDGLEERILPRPGLRPEPRRDGIYPPGYQQRRYPDDGDSRGFPPSPPSPRTPPRQW